ncbi:response regulator transcription factor [Aquisalimonas asiatica]|uniref:Response regulator receiver protein n=1 Tax=Aquisalimonas asiatica TaxID=406100 RepID=A0A1H8Q3G7_9GAMM|nr:response regulator [Aquisalimonas asiatica]SEO48772.1 response regulator receiver protein [Aquisalimonas asiatica]
MDQSVLIVDDEPNIILSLRFLMKAEGYRVRVAQDGSEAIAAVQQEAPDLVLLDVMLPGRDGYQICEELRRMPACANTRIIMLTARGRPVDAEKGLATGADDYVSKPFSTRDLLRRVRDLLPVAAA